MSTAPQVDAYIAQAAPFARPILEKVRVLFHQACPAITETIKWGFPHFEYKGIVGSMAAFKHHASFGFWKGSLLADPHKLFQKVGATTMASLKVSTIDDMPDDAVLLETIHEAIALNDEGVKAPPKKPAKKSATAKEVQVPDYFLAALQKHKKALATFEKFPPSHKREYVEWITEAKQEATRARRIASALEWLSQGKDKNWRYRK